MRIAPCLLALAAGFLAVSCSPYQRDFRQAVAAAQGRHADPTGPWKGTWHSVPSGHDGPLWCIITETPGRAGSYDFRYRAGWGILNFGDYTHTVPVKRRPGGALGVTGSMELPAAVGTYSLDGMVTNDRFDAKYTSTKGDHGTFTLRRPE
ncbi:MAG: hypothetical protein HKN82_00355 [Akkermansiaceae bacterium]|nr:hypothetical protein [Akkermansiaceae bacterium]NNM29625.1 hypothetical protein [Akkermansiaceae bacterium]